jgi:small subunit ribosomal protein S17
MKIFEGVVVSLKTNNTVIVEVTRRTPHPLYRKLIKRSKKYKVDMAGHELAMGQSVKIVETRPISKDKYFKVMESKKPAPKVEASKASQLVKQEVSAARKTTRVVKPAAKAKVAKKVSK